MSRDVPSFDPESGDPWKRLEIDPAIRRRAEHAAAAAGLSVEEWLEDAIRRASPSAAGNESGAAPPTPPADAPRVPVPTIAERLAQQRLDKAKDEQAAPSFVRIGDDDRAEAPADFGTLRAELKAAAASAEEMPPTKQGTRHLAVIAVAIALAMTSGAVTAQYLIPGHSRVPAAPETRIAAATPSAAAPAAGNAPPSPSANDSGGDPSAAANDRLPVAAASTPIDAFAPAGLAAAPASPAPAASAASPASPSAAGGEPSAASTLAAAKREASALPAETKSAASAKSAAPAPKESASGKTASAATPPRPGNDDVAPADPRALAPWLEQRASSGDAIAQYRLGVLYALGQGVRQDYQRAAQLFKSSAEGGVAEAQYNIGVLYERGLGIDHDPAQAAQWYQKAAAQGNANAAFNLGVAYSNGAGVPQSMDRAAQLFHRAAAAGIINAQFNLGLLYERGDGVPVSQTEAYAWYSIAAVRGDRGAAQRRDRLASLLAPATLKEAQARAAQVAATIKNGAPGGGLAAGANKAAAAKP